ncbi:hypothetical protein [Microbulbifer sp. SAOS-129_SWC]|uniref:hypothetical protein n=1 Tax=Microbulbifer sp. SAOS-129_SWC TaxID=3145235 RepID=UPI003217A5C5
MEFITSTADVIGLIIFGFSFIMILTLAFQKGTGWGLSMLVFTPIAAPIFLLKNWNESSFWFSGAAIGLAIMSIF